jgi:hypothetical protein
LSCRPLLSAKATLEVGQGVMKISVPVDHQAESRQEAELRAIIGEAEPIAS